MAIKYAGFIAVQKGTVNMRHFNDYHPLTILIYYVSVLVLVMLTTNPIIIGVAFLLGIIYQALNKPIFKNILWYLLIIMFIALTNPLISYNGSTVLFYVNSNKYTLEAMLYGANFGLMLVTIITWASNLTLDFTSDKILLLFGKIAPKSAMVLTTAIRFIPLYTKQLKRTRETQKTLGLTKESIVDDLYLSLRAFSSTLNYSLENAIDTADMMISRGYSTTKRTNFGLYKFRIVDLLLILTVVCLDVLIFINLSTAEYQFYPNLTLVSFNYIYIFVFIIMALPLIKEIKESVKWKLLQSKI